jgi:ABC-type branched-subunit amino acid transport system substrate-binding protein
MCRRFSLSTEWDGKVFVLFFELRRRGTYTKHLLPLLVMGAGTGGCALVHHLDDYSTREDQPAPTNPSGGNKPTLPTSPPSTNTPTPAPTKCTTNRECLAGRAIEDPAICVKSTGTCAPLITKECPRVYGEPANDNAIVLGTIVDAAAAEERAAVLAAEEIVGVPSGASSLLILGCDSTKPSDVLNASHHLIDDLHVAAVIGPFGGDDVVTTTQQVSVKGGTLLMTAAATSTISNLADENLTWRIVPSDGQRAKLVIEQMNELETLLKTIHNTTTVKLGVVHASNAQGLSAKESITGKLILNGRFISDPANASNISMDAYDPTNEAALGAIAARYANTFKPDFIFLSSAAEAAGLIVPIEQALTAARAVNRPYYVCTDAVKTQNLLTALAANGVPADLKRRIRGIGVKPEIGSTAVLADFVAAFTARYGMAPGVTNSATVARAAAAYDAMYAIAFAITATTPDMPLSGSSVAQGLRALGVGDSVNVGAKNVTAVVDGLRVKKSVALRGTFSPMRWDISGDMQAGAVEVWCIGGATPAAASFGSSGLTMDVANQVIGGAFVQCQ